MRCRDGADVVRASLRGAGGAADVLRAAPRGDAARWRAAVPPEFEFTVKAWQLITHEAKSPTYRRLRTPLSADERAEAGGFRWTPVVARAWETTVGCAEILGASAILLQCPASFRPSGSAVARLREFCFRAHRPAGVRLVWEPRGPWPDELVRELCEELDLTHAADPFLRVSLTPTAYYRLHGITGARHVYTDDELARLDGIVGAGPAYVMFNNLPRAADAERFRRLAHPESGDSGAGRRGAGSPARTSVSGVRGG
ncbi:DUF72 domain-containing protein [Paractinoplanes atraurantiacus]|uniref:DUF72 domain-containing protein n=1 Tax=Paractinoplanes atraurantiacus TaxID=1036182 RepID=UPI001C53F94A|nr:DUF72 domain-containing protein [Actinoplanes atraurantiacus]